MVSIIIPAYNEEKTIGDVVLSVKGHPDVREVIVVDDASTDDTRVRATCAGARVIHLPENRGKAFAMDAGVGAASNDIILFLDGDIVGHTHEKLSVIMDPVLKGRLEMHVGLLPRPSLSLLSKKVFYIAPVLSGMRILTKELWYRVPESQKKGFKIELALNYAARRWGKGTGYEIIPGLVHRTKEKKHGFTRGFYRRLHMMAQIASISFELYVWELLKSVLRKRLNIEFNKL